MRARLGRFPEPEPDKLFCLAQNPLAPSDAARRSCRDCGGCFCRDTRHEPAVELPERLCVLDRPGRRQTVGIELVDDDPGRFIELCPTGFRFRNRDCPLTWQRRLAGDRKQQQAIETFFLGGSI